MTAARTTRRKAAMKRDQASSTFTEILEHLVAVTPSARGAALVDFEGETVDYAGSLDPFELKVAAATWQIVLSELAETSFAGPTQITVRAKRTGFVLRRVSAEYTVVLVLYPRATFAVSERALVEAEAALAHEAGLTRVAQHAWFSVLVRTEAEHRPFEICVGGVWEPLDVMGAVVGLYDWEHGYRIRLRSGAEMMLVRERNNLWFCDESLTAFAAPKQ